MAKMACIIVVSTPYFRARFAAASALNPEIELHSIECGAASDTYAFTPDKTAEGYVRHVISPKPMEQQTPAEIAGNLGKVLERIQPDVVGLPGWLGPTSFLAMRWCIENGVPTVVMSESTAHDEVRIGWREAIKRRYISLASAALAGGTLHARYLAMLGMHHECIFLGYDAVDNGYFAKGAKMKVATQATEGRSISNHRPTSDLTPGFAGPATLSTRWSLQVTPYFLASARFVEKKNLPFLLRAYARYRQLMLRAKVASSICMANPHSPSELSIDVEQPWSLVLLGDGPLRADISHLVSSLGLNDSVVLPGFIQYPELPQYYRGAGAFVHSSTTEQWGLVVNEAMASSLAVIVSNRCGCAPNLVNEGLNGWTFDPNNEEQLSQLMLKVSTLSTEALAKLGDSSAKIVSTWGTERFADGLKKAAGKAIEVGPKRANSIDQLILRALAHR